MHPLGMAGLFKIFLAELFLAAAAGTTNIAVCPIVDENCWVIRDVVACIVSIGMAVDHKNVFAAAFGANVGIFMGEAHSFLRYIVTDSCAAADQILEKAGKCLKAIPHNSKCRYGERDAADAKPKAQIILDVLSSILATQMPCRSRRSGA